MNFIKLKNFEIWFDFELQFWNFRYDDLNVQFDEYQKRSNDLEIELESILKQSDDKIRDLEVANNLLKSDNDKLKVKKKTSI